MIEGINASNDINFLRNLNLDNSSKAASDYQGYGLSVDENKNAEDNTRVAGQGLDNRDSNLGTVETDDNKQDDSYEVNNNERESETDEQLTDEEEQELEELKATDRKVRQHEMAHLSAAQGIAVSGANFQYERGPDGVNYAVGGDVKIDVSKEDDPERTIEKAQKIISAAMAPADPSSQDRAVAADARAMETEARTELSQEQQKKTQETGNSTLDTKSASETGSEDKTPGAVQEEERVGAVNADKNKVGIDAYILNQNFAPTSPLMPEFESLATNPAVPNARPTVFQTGAYLDMVA